MDIFQPILLKQTYQAFPYPKVPAVYYFNDVPTMYIWQCSSDKMKAPPFNGGILTRNIG